MNLFLDPYFFESKYNKKSKPKIRLAYLVNHV